VWKTNGASNIHAAVNVFSTAMHFHWFGLFVVVVAGLPTAHCPLPTAHRHGCRRSGQISTKFGLLAGTTSASTVSSTYEDSSAVPRMGTICEWSFGLGLRTIFGWSLEELGMKLVLALVR